MLKLTIEYESAWRNSFLDGDNNSPLGKGGRKYIASLKSLGDRNADNFIKRSITHNTVMGVLNRLIGDQRKLYMARASDFYPLKDIDREEIVSFSDNVSALSGEIVHLRNFSKSKDQNSFSGMIDAKHPAFNSSFSGELWSVLYLDLESLCDFILNDEKLELVDADPVLIADKYQQEIDKIKGVNVDDPKIDFFDKVLQAEEYLKECFGADYRNTAGNQIKVPSLYCSALYLQIERLSEKNDVSIILSKQGKLSGFSKRGFTYKDFMKNFTTGNGKIVFGNPYFKEVKVKGEGSTKEMLSKASGKLEISINVDAERSYEIKKMIENAGVMTFPLGKKGLAYVSKIKVV